MQSVQKDVSEEVMAKTPRFTPQDAPEPDSEVVYCHAYSKEILNFLTGNGVTMHDPETPPTRILDIGTGNGLWAIEAAKLWKDCEVTGLDYLNIQVKLSSLPEDIAHRIQWIHANFLKQLPFPSSYFDIVHVSRLAIHVPEDRAPLLANEIYRILRPGGVLEVMEEDLIFPHARMLSASRANSTDIFRSDIIYPNYSPSITSDSSSRLSEKTVTGPDSPASSRSLSRSFKFGSSKSTETRLSDPLASQLTLSGDTFEADHRNHSQLAMAWDAMLSNRRVAASGTVMIFYLSSLFAVSHSPPALQIPLPPNSFSKQEKKPETRSSSEDSMFMGVQKPTDKYRALPRSQAPKVMSTLAPMHLARSLAVVIACKDALRKCYIELFQAEYPPPKNTPGKHKQPIDPQSCVRDAFEDAWLHWEGDMRDRINARDVIRTQLHWEEPVDSVSDWRDWRDSVIHSGDGQSTDNLCRNIRALVGWKPMSET
ncbi:S-adenosyl-L-methionine-dependent methyltransferase [Athelia psychrophila]|uniref:S-adenosyl-L-methionine-dependent methyltransferase n=1 Tax=Athelia psychrophila TaxID=1759441 RepID=A0A166NNM8_9AGAM|nr:S-adenosyl-L-methionine-dependent methyltransferase [Fibularhizoctonia sp. CBS 109695]